MRIARILLFTAVLLCAVPAHAAPGMQQYLDPGKTDFSVDDIARMAKTNPEAITDQLAFAFGIQAATHNKDRNEVRNALPASVRQSFDSGWSLGASITSGDAGALDEKSLQEAIKTLKEKK